MEWVAGIVVLAITAVVAFTLGKGRSASQRKIDELEQLIIDKDSELQKYRQQINTHFEKTANLFGKVTQEYQNLYQYMAQSSDALADAQPFKHSLEHRKNQMNMGYQPNDMHADSDFHGEDTFSNESFYRAHDYRNEQSEPAAKENPPEESSDNIIHLDQSKDETKQGEKQTKKAANDNDKEAPPLDYAIKDKGVINHNSLDMDNVKT